MRPKVKYDIKTITPEQAASMTASCNYVEPRGGVGNEPLYFLAALWNGYKDNDYVYAEGKTSLEAVVNVHNKMNEINDA